MQAGGDDAERNECHRNLWFRYMLTLKSKEESGLRGSSVRDFILAA
jgi:hypothetical protein